MNSILQDEKWKDVQGYEGMYQVSNHGRVKSLGQRVAYESRWGTVAYRDYPAKIMHPTDNGNGYLIVSFRKNGHRKNYYIHRLVAEAFIGTIGDLEINHIDYNTKNAEAKEAPPPKQNRRKVYLLCKLEYTAEAKIQCDDVAVWYQQVFHRF